MMNYKISNFASNDRQFSSSACYWLETLLWERFGQKFVVRRETPTSVVIRHVGMPNDAVVFDNLEEKFWIANSELSCSSWRPEIEGWRSSIAGSLAAPGANQLSAPLIERTPRGFVIHYDILGMSYWMLSRQEEIGRTDLDQHGRFPAASSHAFKHGYLERPIVDEWFNILGQVMQHVWPGIELKRLDFNVKVSHDVDAPSRYGFRPWKTLPRFIAGDILKHHDLRGLLGPWVRLSTRTHLHPRDAFNTFDWLMDVSERQGLSSAFYFICDRRGTPHDSDYGLEHPAIIDLIRRIHTRGHEIGLHPSYGTYRDPAQIRREADHLRAVCNRAGVLQMKWGGRMHYLQWEQPTTLRAWNDAGMTYDSTMAYADHAGFRCGTCFEYPAFDPIAHESLQLRIRPLIVMEGSVIGKQYMDLGITKVACEKILELKCACRAVGGCFTLLWHNSSLANRAERQLYEAVISN